MNSEQKQNIFKICKCTREFPTRAKYFYHRKKCKIAMAFAIEHKNFFCRENTCTYKCRKYDSFLEHLRMAHGFEMEEYSHVFLNYSDFERWKDAFEAEKNSFFICQHSIKRLTKTVKYYICNRSGKSKQYENKDRRRKFKRKGDRKIGYNCPARITAHEDISSKKVTAYIQPQHYGHEIEVEYLPLPKSVQQEIALQLFDGVPQSDILNQMFSSYDNDLKRQHLCSTRDISYISKIYGVNKKCNDNVTSEPVDSSDESCSDSYILKKTNDDNSRKSFKRNNDSPTDDQIDSFSELCDYSYMFKNVNKEDNSKLFTKTNDFPTDKQIDSSSELGDDGYMFKNFNEEHDGKLFKDANDSYMIPDADDQMDSSSELCDDRFMFKYINEEVDKKLIKKGSPTIFMVRVDSSAESCKALKNEDEKNDEKSIKARLLNFIPLLMKKINDCEDNDLLLCAQQTFTNVYNDLKLGNKYNKE